MSQIWSGRFSEKTDDLVKKFTESISYDYRLAEYDLLLVLSYAKELKKAGVFTPAELTKINAGCKSIAQEIRTNKFIFHNDLEDIHMNIESALIKKVGDVGKKIHTGKSRNDQVATITRMFVKEEIANIKGLLLKLCQILITTAEKNKQLIMPGYTHLQVAQPVLMAHHLLAYVEMFIRDIDRLTDVYKRTDVLPLGSAALAGTTYKLNRKALALSLGFAKISENSMDAVSDRDFIIEFQAAAALIMLHLSRMSEELILWNSQEYEFIEMSDRYTTGSSIMPQKKNPDVPELVRGKTGRVIGALMSIISIVKNLPLTYNRDLQEDKEELFKVVDIVKDSLEVMFGLWSNLQFRPGQMRAAVENGYAMATDLADYLVEKGVPFRVAHETTGKLVKYCISQRKKINDLGLSEFKKFEPRIEKDIYDVITPEASIKARNIYGGTAANQVVQAIKRAKSRLK